MGVIYPDHPHRSAVRSAVLLEPSAYLASAASTTELASSLLPVRLRDAVDSGIEPDTSAWYTTGTLSTAYLAHRLPR